ncbi:MAG: exodeoxyribonuclease VII small subunit [Alphaproteobacteria bacterium]|nr:exodeoxyribonuclease VII small subunit [Alphaproteobacteria bacterium]
MAKNDIEKLSFEDAMKELENIVRQLESGNADLKTSIDAYERGVKLRQHCAAQLKDAQMKIEKISIGPDGTADTTAFAAE